MRKIAKGEQERKEKRNRLAEKHNMLCCATVDELFSAIYDEFSINDTDIIIDSGESVDYDVDGGWEDTDNNRAILHSIYEYAADCASGF
jgi:hypothetical protein